MKKYDVVARLGSYTDRNGQEKSRFENVGVVIQNSNGGFNLLLKKTFNPAGLAEPGQESVILSLFEPQSQQQAPQQTAMQAQAPQHTQPDDLSQDIPF